MGCEVQQRTLDVSCAGQLGGSEQGEPSKAGKRCSTALFLKALGWTGQIAGMLQGWAEQIVRMPLRAVPGAAVAKALLSAREVISVPQPKPSSFRWPGGTASGSQQRGEQRREQTESRESPLCFPLGPDKAQHFHPKAKKSANLAWENFTSLPRNAVLPQHQKVYPHL